jgi:membrane-associated phospholipid phosphatase
MRYVVVLAWTLAVARLAVADAPSTPPEPAPVDPAPADPDPGEATPAGAASPGVAPLAPVSGIARRERPGLRVHRWATSAFIVAGGVVWAASDRVLQDTISPSSCRIICEDEINGFDATIDSLKWDDDTAPQYISDAAAYVAVPLIAFGGLGLAAYQQGNQSDFLDDALVVGEATVVTGLINRLTALSFGRTRPRTRMAPPGDPVLQSRQAYQSFFSGHTSAAFSVGIAAAQVASLRRYRIAPWLWAGAITFGTLTGYMRLAGADHYPSDVITGAGVATVIAMVIPRLHHTRRGPQVMAAPSHDGAIVSLSAGW